MNTLDVLASAPAQPADLTVVVVGHVAVHLPRAIEQAAARLAKGEGPSRELLLAPDGRYLLLKLEEKPWHVGGETWRILGGAIADAAREAKAQRVAVPVGPKTAARALAEGLVLGDYRFIQLRSGKAAERKPIAVHLIGAAAAEVAAGVRAARAQNLARELADLPPNLLDPRTFARRALAEVRGLGLTAKVIAGTAALRRAGFPGLAQVGQAGSAEPHLVALRWRPRQAAKGVRLGLVGKGITFDSGGISIKPGDKMWEMKADMSGAAAVLAAMTLIARERIPIAVDAYLCLAENMPDARAQRPGDIYRARNGKSIHVDNTDAEGRLVLADVLTYACEQGATHLVDVATLTGACVVALGEGIAGLMGRGDGFLDLVREAGQEVGEEHWKLPLFGEYRSLLDHPHADINNTGGRWGGALTAGLFLAEFVPDTVKWAHLDIAGPAIRPGGWRYFAKGMTGYATRTLARLAAKLG
jgi:leucyl aminopeptidase